MVSVLESEPLAEQDQNAPPPPANLPSMISLGDGFAPAAAVDLRATGLSPLTLSNLVLKAAYTVPQFTTEWAARRLHLPQALVGDVLEQQRTEHLLEVLGQAGPFGYRYGITNRGRERADRLMEVSGYVGPAPVSLESYNAMMEWQLAQFPRGDAPGRGRCPERAGVGR